MLLVIAALLWAVFALMLCNSMVLRPDAAASRAGIKWIVRQLLLGDSGWRSDSAAIPAAAIPGRWRFRRRRFVGVTAFSIADRPAFTGDGRTRKNDELFARIPLASVATSARRVIGDR